MLLIVLQIFIHVIVSIIVSGTSTIETRLIFITDTARNLSDKRLIESLINYRNQLERHEFNEYAANIFLCSDNCIKHLRVFSSVDIDIDGNRIAFGPNLRRT